MKMPFILWDGDSFLEPANMHKLRFWLQYRQNLDSMRDRLEEFEIGYASILMSRKILEVSCNFLSGMEQITSNQKPYAWVPYKGSLQHGINLSTKGFDVSCILAEPTASVSWGVGLLKQHLPSLWHGRWRFIGVGCGTTRLPCSSNLLAARVPFSMLLQSHTRGTLTTRLQAEPSTCDSSRFCNYHRTDRLVSLGQSFSSIAMIFSMISSMLNYGCNLHQLISLDAGSSGILMDMPPVSAVRTGGAQSSMHGMMIASSSTKSGQEGSIPIWINSRSSSWCT